MQMHSLCDGAFGAGILSDREPRHRVEGTAMPLVPNRSISGHTGEPAEDPHLGPFSMSEDWPAHSAAKMMLPAIVSSGPIPFK